VDGLVLDEQFTANGVDLLIALGDAHRASLQQQLADLSRGRSCSKHAEHCPQQLWARLWISLGQSLASYCFHGLQSFDHIL
ncbi:DUF1949 domain-containing protein, partial [Pseudomonas putida]|uniref:DUF1949 domain-containing protein n=1 Tax=Pseudomonas putida TaxID=303 RepID=UPI001E3FFCF7